jgi:hypothetical protein
MHHCTAVNANSSSLKALFRAGFAGNKFASCTNFCHVPVDALHSIENARLTKREFPLTAKTKRVET